MKLIFTHFKKLKALGLSAAFLVTGQTCANAQQQLPNLTPAQAQHLSRDLVPSNSQNFFRQGQELIEREIKILRQRQLSSTKPVLKINLMPQGKKDRPLNQEPNSLSE